MKGDLRRRVKGCLVGSMKKLVEFAEEKKKKDAVDERYLYSSVILFSTVL